MSPYWKFVTYLHFMLCTLLWILAFHWSYLVSVKTSFFCFWPTQVHIKRVGFEGINVFFLTSFFWGGGVDLITLYIFSLLFLKQKCFLSLIHVCITYLIISFIHINITHLFLLVIFLFLINSHFFFPLSLKNGFVIHKFVSRVIKKQHFIYQQNTLEEVESNNQETSLSKNRTVCIECSC